MCCFVYTFFSNLTLEVCLNFINLKYLYYKYYSFLI